MRRNSPSVMPRRPRSSWNFTMSRIASSSTARSAAAVIAPFWNCSRASSSRRGPQEAADVIGAKRRLRPRAGSGGCVSLRHGSSSLAPESHATRREGQRVQRNARPPRAGKASAPARDCAKMARWMSVRKLDGRARAGAVAAAASALAAPAADRGAGPRLPRRRPGLAPRRQPRVGHVHRATRRASAKWSFAARCKRWLPLRRPRSCGAATPRTCRARR